MQFTSLILLASAVLAMPTAGTSKCSKKVPEQKNTEVKDPNKIWKYSSDGRLCSSFRDADLVDTPTECIKAVACVPAVSIKWGICEYDEFQNFTSIDKDQLLKYTRFTSCVDDLIICPENAADLKPLE